MPACAQAVRPPGSISTAFISERSRTIPPSEVPNPARLWPPLRTASSAPVSRARLTVRETSDASATRTIAAGRRSNPVKKTRRASSYPGSSGAITLPFRLARRLEIGISGVGSMCTPCPGSGSCYAPSGLSHRLDFRARKRVPEVLPANRQVRPGHRSELCAALLSWCLVCNQVVSPSGLGCLADQKAGASLPPRARGRCVPDQAVAAGTCRILTDHS